MSDVDFKKSFEHVVQRYGYEEQFVDYGTKVSDLEEMEDSSKGNVTGLVNLCADIYADTRAGNPTFDFDAMAVELMILAVIKHYIRSGPGPGLGSTSARAYEYVLDHGDDVKKAISKNPDLINLKLDLRCI